MKSAVHRLTSRSSHSPATSAATPQNHSYSATGTGGISLASSASRTSIHVAFNRSNVGRRSLTFYMTTAFFMCLLLLVGLFVKQHPSDGYPGRQQQQQQQQSGDGSPDHWRLRIPDDHGDGLDLRSAELRYELLLRFREREWKKHFDDTMAAMNSSASMKHIKRRRRDGAVKSPNAVSENFANASSGSNADVEQRNTKYKWKDHFQRDDDDEGSNNDDLQVIRARRAYALAAQAIADYQKGRRSVIVDAAEQVSGGSLHGGSPGGGGAAYVAAARRAAYRTYGGPMQDYWPAGLNVRRRRRYSAVAPRPADLDGKRSDADARPNPLGCPSHRSSSPYGFLPGGRPDPIDSVIAASLPSSAQRAEDVVRAMMSRSDLEDSLYFTYLPLTRPERGGRSADESGLTIETPGAGGALYECTWTSSSNATLSSPSSSSSSGNRSHATPLYIDVVYTYVNGSAASLQKDLQQRGEKYDPHRYRDWNEILFSLRSIYHRAICAPGTGSGAERSDGTPRLSHTIPCRDTSSLIRYIHIVVSERDQVPAWIETNHPFIRVVTHRDIFPWKEGGAGGGGQRTYPHLPTFNSHAIELQLHRIPGLSRFFLYLNNDMLLGRRLSVFDLFRPVSAYRREWRRIQGEACVLPTSTAPLGGGGGNGADDTGTTIFLEPIIYGEAMSRNCQPRRKRGAAKRLLLHLRDDALASAARPHDRSDPAKSPVSNHSGCWNHPIRPSFLYDLECFYANRREFDSDEMLRKISFNQRLVFDRLDGVAVVHTYPHAPQLFDRLLVERFVERDFADVAELTRRSPRRSDTDLWLTMIYSSYALAHRMAIDTVADDLRERLVDAQLQQAGQQDPAARSRVTAHVHLWRPHSWMNWADTLQRRKNSKYNGGGNGSNAADSKDESTTASPAVVGNIDAFDIPFDESAASHLQSLGRNFFRTDGWMRPRYHFGRMESDETKERVMALGKAFDVKTMNPDALLSCARRSICSSVLKEKLRRYVVYLFEKMSSYRFCQIRDKLTGRMCLKDAVESTVGTGSRLFWALNDDWGLAPVGRLVRRRNMIVAAPPPELVDGGGDTVALSGGGGGSSSSSGSSSGSSGSGGNANESATDNASGDGTAEDNGGGTGQHHEHDGNDAAVAVKALVGRALLHVRAQGGRSARVHSALRSSDVNHTAAAAPPARRHVETARRGASTASPNLISSDAHDIFLSIMLVLTRFGPAAPWEKEHHVEDAQSRLLLRSRIGDPPNRGEDPKAVAAFMRNTLKDTQTIVQRDLAVLRRALKEKPLVLEKLEDRQDVKAFLRNAWRQDRRKPQSQWLENLLDFDD